MIVGTTFHGEIPKPRRESAPKRQPAYVRYDASAASALREVRAKAGFPLMVPTVLERSSSPDYEQFVRAYKIGGGKKAVRMVYRTGATSTGASSRPTGTTRRSSPTAASSGS